MPTPFCSKKPRYKKRKDSTDVGECVTRYLVERKSLHFYQASGQDSNNPPYAYTIRTPKYRQELEEHRC